MRFAPSDPTVGIELELQLLDAESLDLADGIMPLIEFYPQRRYVKPELVQSCVEIATPVCTDSAAAGARLRKTLASVMARCDELGMRLCGGGTHTFGRKLGLITPTPRYLRLKHDFGIIGRNQITFGTHVHVGMPSGNAAMFVMRHMVPCLPLLTALGANSPFWRGHDTGYAAYRQCILAAAPSYGLPENFEDWDDFTRFVKAGQQAGVLESFKSIHWDLRPNPKFGTLEVRAMDATSTIEEAVALAALTRSIMVYLLDHVSDDLNHWPFARQSHWNAYNNRYNAGHYGLEARYITDRDGTTRPLRDMIGLLLDVVTPAAEAIGESAGIQAIRDQLKSGLGYQQQQALLTEQRGDYVGVTRALVNALRGELADASSAVSDAARVQSGKGA
jgi:carboxylate-amine ligase